jgi:hypothetical protein
MKFVLNGSNLVAPRRQRNVRDPFNLAITRDDHGLAAAESERIPIWILIDLGSLLAPVR